MINETLVAAPQSHSMAERNVRLSFLSMNSGSLMLPGPYSRWLSLRHIRRIQLWIDIYKPRIGTEGSDGPQFKYRTDALCSHIRRIQQFKY